MDGDGKHNLTSPPEVNKRHREPFEEARESQNVAAEKCFRSANEFEVWHKQNELRSTDFHEAPQYTSYKEDESEFSNAVCFVARQSADVAAMT